MEEITNKAITISGIEMKDGKITLMEQVGGQQYPTKYSFFENTQSGTPSKAFTQFQKLKPQIGQIVNIAVKETQGTNKMSGKPVTYRNIAYFVTGQSDVPQEPQNSTTGQNRPSGGYQKQPPKDFKATMDYKGTQIAKMQDNKEESMRLFSSGRDATLVITSTQPNAWSEEEMKAKIKECRDWFYQNIYTMSEDEYKRLNPPF
jgi:hypothetical protein